MRILVFRSGTESITELAYDSPARSLNPAALLAELVTLRVAVTGPDPSFDPLEEGDEPSS